MEDYDAVLVTLIGDVATAYTQLRTLQTRRQFALANIQLQRGTLAVVENRFKGGVATDLDVEQARSNLAQTEA